MLHAWSPPIITPSSGSRPLRTQVHSRGQRPENSLQIAFEVRKCILDSSFLLILTLFFYLLILSFDFGNRVVEGQRASEDRKPPGQMFFFKNRFLRWRWTYRK